MEKLTDNELIARFMGNLKLVTRDDGYWVISGQGMLKPNNFEYETSWDWLMPVVEKIESIYDDHHGYFAVHISSNGCNIQGTNLWKTLEGREGYNTPDTAVYMSDPNAILGTKLESTYYNVVQFIKWYNQQKA